MNQRIAQALRYLSRLTDDQHTARANAAEGSATLRKRRQDQEDVDEYLARSRPSDNADDVLNPGMDSARNL